MAAILQKTFLNVFPLMKKFEFAVKIVSEGPIGNRPALIQKMAWHQRGVGPSCERMLP